MERTQEEVIKIFEEKQHSAERSLNAIKDIKSKAGEQKQLFGEALAYEDCIAFLRGCTIVEEHKALGEEKKLLEPLCNKCSKTKEACPFNRIGSAYEDCSEFVEQLKPNEDVGKDMLKLKENTPKSNKDKYIEELLNDSIKLQNELAQYKNTIVELANEVTTYRKIARDRG